jgi:hypothetical protein
VVLGFHQVVVGIPTSCPQTALQQLYNGFNHGTSMADVGRKLPANDILFEHIN